MSFHCRIAALVAACSWLLPTVGIANEFSLNETILASWFADEASVCSMTSADCCGAGMGCGTGCGSGYGGLGAGGSGCLAPAWHSGVEFTFMGVDRRNGGGAFTSVAGDAGAIELETFSDGSGDLFTYAPRLWLGRYHGDWGVVTRFWYLSDSQGSNSPVILPPDQLFAWGTDSSLTMYNIDLELMRRFVYNSWKMDAGFGFRYAAFESGVNSSTSGQFSADEFALATAGAGSDFYGSGLTFALAGRRQIGCSSAHFFWNARGSTLWGNASANAFSETWALDGGGAVSFDRTAAAAGGSTDLWIGEFQTGVQWEHPLRCIPANALFRVAFEYQRWDVGGSGLVFSDSFAIANNVGAFAESGAGAGSLQADLYGLAIGTGFTW